MKTKDNRKVLSAINRSLSKLESELDIAYSTFQAVNSSTKQSIKRILENDDLMQKRNLLPLRNEEDQLSKKEPVESKITENKVESEVLPVGTLKKTRKLRNSKLSSMKKDSLKDIPTSTVHKEALRLENILKQARQIRTRGLIQKKDEKMIQPSASTNVRRQVDVHEPVLIETFTDQKSNPTKKTDSFRNKLQKYHRLLRNQYQRLTGLEPVYLTYIKNMQPKCQRSMGHFDISFLHNRATLLGIYDYMGMMQQDLISLFTNDYQDEVLHYEKDIVERFFVIYKLFNDTIANALINIEEDEEIFVKDYETTCLEALTGGEEPKNGSSCNLFQLYLDTPQAYFSRWLPMQISTGTTRSIIDLIYPSTLELDPNIGQMCMLYENENELCRIHELRHEIQKLVLERYIEQMFTKELLPILFEMQSNLDRKRDESALKDYMHLWRLSYSVLIDRGEKLVMIVRKQ